MVGDFCDFCGLALIWVVSLPISVISDRFLGCDIVDFGDSEADLGGDVADFVDLGSIWVVILLISVIWGGFGL